MKNLIRKAKKATVLYLSILLPVDKKKIVCSSYVGKGYSDNLKYIADELIKHEDLKVIWLVKNEKEKEGLPKQIKACKYNSLAQLYHHVTAGVWLDNSRKSFYFKRKEQLYIQTWHGGGAQKRIEKDVEDKLSVGYVKGAKKDSKQIDLMISESRFLTNLYHNSFWYDGPVWECGYPRYDVLLSNHDDITNKVYDHFNIDKDKLIVLYAPTFRQDCSTDIYDLDFEKIKPVLESKFGKQVVFLVRLHPNIADKETKIKYDNVNIINASLYPDSQELLCAASVLIGDYSSINYDFALMGKPVFRYATDIAEYMADRDFYLPFEKYPYPYAESNNDLVKIIENFDATSYQNTLNKFFDESGLVVNKHSSKDVADFIFDFVNKKCSKQAFMQKNSNKFIFKNK